MIILVIIKDRSGEGLDGMLTKGNKSDIHFLVMVCQDYLPHWYVVPAVYDCILWSEDDP